MIERLIIAGAVAALTALAVTGGAVLQRRRVETTAAGAALLGVPTVLYFWTETCVPCKTIQTPALDRLEAALGEGVRVVRINAAEQIEEAQRWGVMTTPTTIVLGADGQPRHINNRPTKFEQLHEQVKGE